MPNPEIVSRLRAIAILVMATLLVVTQLAESTFANEAGALPIVGWALLCGLLIVYIGPAGPFGQARKAGLEDEGTVANRSGALKTGFWVAIATGALVYLVPALTGLPAREAARLIVSAAIAAAAVHFAIAELRAIYA